MEKRQDIALGLIFVIVGLAAAWMASSYSGASGTYPMTLGLILTLLGGTVAARAVRTAPDKARQLVAAPSKIITTTVIAAAYVAAIVPFGFYTASFLLMMALPIALDNIHGSSWGGRCASRKKGAAWLMAQSWYV